MSLATQLLSAAVTVLVQEVIDNDDIVLPFQNKIIYNHVADLCEKWNNIVDICNGKDGPCSPANAIERQTQLLDILDWFSKWRSLHDKLVEKGEATE